MITNHTIESLAAFEAHIAALYDGARIRAPIHLSAGNEQQLIDIFEEIRPKDYVAGSWRFHLHCLLKGVPPAELERAIVEDLRSITLCFPEYRLISSAIVGGIVPIALGIAMGIKRRGGTEKVWCFVGDMTVRTGIFSECLNYAAGHDLPIVFVIEDNGLSVMTPTGLVWGNPRPNASMVRGYKYSNPYPHSGGTKGRINF